MKLVLCSKYLQSLQLAWHAVCQFAFCCNFIHLIAAGAGRITAVSIRELDVAEGQDPQDPDAGHHHQHEVRDCMLQLPGVRNEGIH